MGRIIHCLFRRGHHEGERDGIKIAAVINFVKIKKTKRCRKANSSYE
jgi:hypothetical protein